MNERFSKAQKLTGVAVILLLGLSPLLVAMVGYTLIWIVGCAPDGQLFFLCDWGNRLRLLSLVTFASVPVSMLVTGLWILYFTVFGQK
jgi:hypothetical protein